MNRLPRSVPGMRYDRMIGWFAVAILLAMVLTAHADKVRAQSESPTPAVTATPTPSPVPTATPESTETTSVPTLAPDEEPVAPTPDLSRTFVAAWSAARNPDPAHGGPLLLLDGWRFRATFEDATVVRSQTVTDTIGDSANPAFWEIEFTDAGPAQAVVTVVPRGSAPLIDARCIWTSVGDFDEHSVAASRDGNSVSFEVGRGVEFDNATYPQDYECFFIYPRATAPPTDTIEPSRPTRSDGPAILLVIVLGIIAGTLVATTRRVIRG